MNRALQQPIAQHLAVIAAGILILFSRKPDLFLNPQFWAEDGRNWYADAYNLGPIVSFLIPEAGYFQTYSRFVAAAAQIFPLASAPLFFNLTAVLLQASVAAFLVSDRSKLILTDRRSRVALAFLYLAMPHAWEVFGNLTNSQWHLALLVCLIFLSDLPSTKLGKAFDIVVVTVSALSGPFCLLIFPVAWIQVLRTKSRHYPLLAAIVTAGCAIQTISLLTSVREVQSELGASFELLFQMIGRHLVIGPILGIRGFAAIAKAGLWSNLTAVSVTVVAIVAGAYIGYKVSAELRLLLLFAVLVCIAAFGWPAVTLEPGQWRAIAENDTALRYWFVPTFALYACILYLAAMRESGNRRYPAFAILALCTFGAITDWRIPPLKDLSFHQHAVEFEQAPTGTVAAIPINPDWKMELKKK